jgi:hypothetical protein
LLAIFAARRQETERAKRSKESGETAKISRSEFEGRRQGWREDFFTGASGFAAPSRSGAYSLPEPGLIAVKPAPPFPARAHSASGFRITLSKIFRMR